MSSETQMAIACPACGSDAEIAADWEACVSIRFENGRAVQVNLGGFTECLPDLVVCGSCGEEFHFSAKQALSMGFGTVAPGQLLEAICAAAPTRHSDGYTLPGGW